MPKSKNQSENAEGGSAKATAGTTPEALPKNAEEGTLVGDPKSLEKAAGVESDDDRAVAISQLDEVRTESQQPDSADLTGFGENAEFTRPEDRR